MLTLALTLLAGTVSAQTILSKHTLLNKVEIDATPSFFFKVHGSGDFLSYTVAKNPNMPAAEGINHLLNVKTSEDSILPGPWDPVFVTDTNFMIIPDRANTLSNFNFYSLTNNKKSSVLHEAIPYVTGTYQSVGVRADGSFRLIAELSHMRHEIKDFKFDEVSSKLIVNKADEEEYICPNYSIKLPMLSKDGEYLSGVDIITKKTAIFKINDDYSCTKIVDIGIKTGKLNFNYDSSKVTYHLYGPSQEINEDSPINDDYIPIPDGDYVANIFVMDLKTKEITPITANSTGNSLYPDFTRDGRLVFITHPQDKNEKVNFSFVELK